MDSIVIILLDEARDWTHPAIANRTEIHFCNRQAFCR